MLKKLKEKRNELSSRGNSGFTLMELIIVIAILAMLIGMLLPRFANYTDKAMGAAAGVDTKNILTVATAFNLDNNDAITLAQLQTATGLSGAGDSAKTLTQPDPAQTSQFTYTYLRGDSRIVAVIDTQSSTIQYTITGADTSKYTTAGVATPPAATNVDQANRIAKGLGF